LATTPDKPKPNTPENATRPRLRWRRAVPVALMLLAASILAYAVLLEIKSRHPGVTIENFQRLKAGMTEKQIESFLGPKWAQMKNDGWEGDNPFPKTCSWHGEQFWVHVDFDSKGRAGGIQLIPLQHRGPD
jgi:hypothetical protein